MTSAAIVWPVICGPTAAGKSALAMALAERYDLEILSADSRQIYRRFDIGTAKPTAEERAQVPHAGIDICEPTERYSAHQWAHDAETWAIAARDRGRASLIVGGTGFYIRALIDPFDALPTLDPARRAALGAWLDELDQASLERWCRRLDPSRAHLGRTQRLRAVETALLTGVPLSVAFEQATRTPPRYLARYLVVDPGPSLATRIADRVDAMIRGGWPEEVERLLRTVDGDAPAWKASGYGAMRDAVQGRMTMQAARDAIVIETRQYAKRQRTWFRHQLPTDAVTRLDPSAPDALAQAERWWAHDAGNGT